MSNIARRPSVAAEESSVLGTLMWVGNGTHPEFRDAYDYCIANAAQVALRRDLHDAVLRPAAEVRCILIERPNRAPLDNDLLNQLSSKNPLASTRSLYGSLCHGMRPSDDADPVCRRMYWNGWNQDFPDWIAPCGSSALQPHSSSADGVQATVAVVADSLVQAEPLLDVAAHGGATAFWCRQDELFRVRNAMLVWWDDSAASPASVDRWRQRLASAGNGDARHAWIVNAPQEHQYQQAYQGGVDSIFSKPFRVEALLKTVRPVTAMLSQPRLRAA